jgi:hypothetical protein
MHTETATATVAQTAVPVPSPADDLDGRPSLGSRPSTRTPPLTSIFPKYGVLAFFLGIIVVSLGVPRAWIWQECLSCMHLQTIYHNNGIQFTYFRNWHVVEHRNDKYENVNGKNEVSTLNINVEGPHNAVITFAIFEPSYPKPLETYADHMRTRFAAALDDEKILAGPLEPVTGRIHGANYNGFRYHFTPPTSMTSSTSCYQYFYELRTPTNEIMVSLQLPEEYVDSAEVNLILDSITLDTAAQSSSSSSSLR